MIYRIELYKSVNSLKFGTSKSEVREILGNFNHITERDMFANCFTEYRENKLISIEVFGDFVVEINGIVFSSSD